MFVFVYMVTSQRSKATQDLKKALQKRLEEMLEEEEPVKEMTGSLLEQMKKHQLPEHEVVVMVRAGARVQMYFVYFGVQKTTVLCEL